MYILKNAIINIWRNKGRNILIGIIIIIISSACAIGLSINNAASKIVKSYEEKYQIEATISMNRENLMGNFKEFDSQEDMIESFNNIESLSLDELKDYASIKYVDSFSYTYSINIDADDIDEVTDTLMKETTSTTTKSFGNMPNMPGMPSGGSQTTTTKTEKIFNAKADGGAFTLVGYDSYESMSDFISGDYTITEGEVSSDFSSNSCVISEELATLNDIEVGDTITLVNPNDEDLTYELTVTGIYTENTEESGDMSRMFTNSANKIITNINVIEKICEDDEDINNTITPTYIFKNSSDLEKFEKIVNKKLNEYYEVTDNLETVLASTKSVTNVKTFALTFLIITFIIGAIVLLVINMINIRERKYEIGVLRVIGMKKSKVALQFIYELLIVCFISLIIGTSTGALSSTKVANMLLSSEISKVEEENNDISKNFGKMNFDDMQRPDENNTNLNNETKDLTKNETIEERKEIKFNGVSTVTQVSSMKAIVNFKVICQLFGMGLLLTLISSIASILSISRFSPLNILKERS